MLSTHWSNSRHLTIQIVHYVYHSYAALFFHPCAAINLAHWLTLLLPALVHHGVSMGTVAT